MGRVILLNKSCTHKTSLADGPRNRCPFSNHRTYTSQRRSEQLREEGLCNKPILWPMHHRLLSPVVSLESPSCLFLNLSNRGSDLCFGHNAPYSSNVYAQRSLWQRVTTATFSHASRAHWVLPAPKAAHRATVSQTAPFFRNDLKSHLYPLPQARLESASYTGKDTWEAGNNIAQGLNDVGTTTHIMNLGLQDTENAPFSLQHFRVQALQ